MSFLCVCVSECVLDSIRQWWARVGPLAHAPLFLFIYFFAFLSVARPCLIRPWCEAATAFVYKAARDEGVAGPQTESVKELRRAAGKCAFFFTGLSALPPLFSFFAPPILSPLFIPSSIRSSGYPPYLFAGSPARTKPMVGAVT